MIKINIKKQNVITNSAQFETQAEADSWLNEQIANESFGKAQHQKEVTPKIINGDGTTTPATYVTVPSEYTVEQVDVTNEVNQSKVNADSLSYLAATDYLVIKSMESGIPMDEVVKGLRAEARLRIVR